MVHQHFMLIPSLTVGENIVLGCEPIDDGRLLRHREGQRRDPRALRALRPGDRSRRAHRRPAGGLQQRVEILKVLYRGADILILDEPTAVLTPQETDELFDVLRGLEQQGKTIIFITHKLREVLEISDRVTVHAARQGGRRADHAGDERARRSRA